jgi:uncharacterized protein YaiL (DUF2058 family)
MGNAFQDQFLKAGLVDEKKVKQAQKEQHRAKKQGKHQPPVNTTREASARAKAEQVARDKELNRQRQEAAQQKALAAQVRQMILTSRLDREDGDSPYHFTDDGRVKQLYVTEAQRGQLGRGQLAIATLDGRYELIPKAVAEKIRQRDPARIILLVEAATPADQPDDPYADFKVPDDLIW